MLIKKQNWTSKEATSCGEVKETRKLRIWNEGVTSWRRSIRISLDQEVEKYNSISPSLQLTYRTVHDKNHGTNNTDH